MKTKFDWTPAIVTIIFLAFNIALCYYYGNRMREMQNLLREREIQWKGMWEEMEKHQEDSLDEWTTLEMAIVMTESQFNPEAVGTSEDWGIFQITPVYAREVNRILKEDVYTHEDAFDVGKSIEMFSVMQSHYNPGKDVDTALRYHNRAGWYAKKVKDNITFIKRMEEVRRQLRSLRDS